MRLLLDTHTFIWWNAEPKMLSDYAFALCNDIKNQLFLSVICIWEIQIKAQAGRLDINEPLSDIVAGHQRDNNIEILPIVTSHVLDLDNLPLHRRAPFDRLLIAQVRVERMTLLSIDRQFPQYPVDVIWAQPEFLAKNPEGPHHS